MQEIKYKDIHPTITDSLLKKIPESMREADRWVIWGGEKVPADGNKLYSGHYCGATVTDPRSWLSFDKAVALAAAGAPCKVAGEYFHACGIGFVVGDDWFCADLDGGKGHKGREPVPREAVQDALNQIGTYTETSLSGCGYHVFGRGFTKAEADPESWEPNKQKYDGTDKKSYEIEFFTRRKYIAITGNRLDGSPEDATDCGEAAAAYYNKNIFEPWKADEATRERDMEQARQKATTYSPDDAERMFLLNYPEILMYADSSEFKRGGRGVQLKNGEYSWIGALKAMKEIGVPFGPVLDWCRRGSNFRSDRDVERVWNETSGSGKKFSVAGLVKSAKEHGWKIEDPEKMTGACRAAHEAAEEWKAAATRMSSSGIRTYGWDDMITEDYEQSARIEYVDPETGEILSADPAAQGTEVVEGITIHQATEVKPEAQEEQEPVWEPIEKRKALPAFPLDTLPDWIREHIDNFAENTGVSRDFCAACVFGAVSSVVCGHLDVHFNGTHYEPAQLYTVFVGRSGAMKSAVIKQFAGPARTWLIEQNKRVKDHNKSLQAEISKIESEIQAEQRKRTKKDSTKITELSAEAEQIRNRLKPLYPVPLDDVTPESLVRSIITSRGTATIAATEGNILNVLTGHVYNPRGATPNIDVFLKGHDGEPLHSYRVNSGETEIERVDISMLLSIQPNLLRRLCTSEDAVGRGLVQRFLIFAPDEVETFIDHTQPTTMEPQKYIRWKEHIQAIAERFMQPDNNKPVIMELHMVADAIIRQFWNYESELLKDRGPADEESIIGWIAKLHGKALRLAAIIALLRDPKAPYITDEDAETAVRLLKEYFIPHYIGIYETADILPKEQRMIVNWIKRRAERTGNRDNFQDRELRVDLRQRTVFSKKGTLDAALTALQESHYLRPVKEATRSGRGRPSQSWLINPGLFEK